MGVPIDLLLAPETLPPEFLCPICHDVISPLDAVQTPCGHMACGPCLSRSMRMVGPECPSDRTPLREADLKSVREHNPLVYRILGRCQVRCENHDRECAWQGELSELAIHLAACPRTLMRCDDCGSRVAREEMDVHHFQCSRQCEDCLEKDIELAEYRKELVKVRAELKNCMGELKELRAQQSRQMIPPSPSGPSTSARGFIQTEDRSYPVIYTDAVGRQRRVSDSVESKEPPIRQIIRRSSAPSGKQSGGTSNSKARVYPLDQLPRMSYNDTREGLGLEPIDSDDDNPFR